MRCGDVFGGESGSRAVPRKEELGPLDVENAARVRKGRPVSNMMQGISDNRANATILSLDAKRPRGGGRYEEVLRVRRSHGLRAPGGRRGGSPRLPPARFRGRETIARMDATRASLEEKHAKRTAAAAAAASAALG